MRCSSSAGDGCSAWAVGYLRVRFLNRFQKDCVFFIERAADVVLTLWEHVGIIQFVRHGPLAQLVEQRPFKAWVTGSNPVWLIGIYTGANTI